MRGEERRNHNNPVHTAAIQWDFGEGLTAVGNLSTSHVFRNDGVYWVTLTITDEAGAAVDDQLMVVVANAAPEMTGFPDVSIQAGDILRLLLILAMQVCWISIS